MCGAYMYNAKSYSMMSMVSHWVSISKRHSPTSIPLHIGV